MDIVNESVHVQNASEEERSTFLFMQEDVHPYRKTEDFHNLKENYCDPIVDLDY